MSHGALCEMTYLPVYFDASLPANSAQEEVQAGANHTSAVVKCVKHLPLLVVVRMQPHRAAEHEVEHGDVEGSKAEDDEQDEPWQLRGTT